MMTTTPNCVAVVSPSTTVARTTTRGPSSDDGFTLIEVIVTMTLLSLFFAVFSGGLAAAYTSARQLQNAASAQTEANLAFLQLDRELRPATGISSPGQVGSASFVEFLTVSGSTATCTELRVDPVAATLAQRAWALISPLPAPGPWSVLASGVSASQPFTTTSATATVPVTTLTVSLQTTAGQGDSRRTRMLRQQFSARNSGLVGSDATACQTQRSIS